LSNPHFRQSTLLSGLMSSPPFSPFFLALVRSFLLRWKLFCTFFFFLCVVNLLQNAIFLLGCFLSPKSPWGRFTQRDPGFLFLACAITKYFDSETFPLFPESTPNNLRFFPYWQTFPFAFFFPPRPMCHYPVSPVCPPNRLGFFSLGSGLPFPPGAHVRNPFWIHRGIKRVLSFEEPPGPFWRPNFPCFQPHYSCVVFPTFLFPFFPFPP